MPNMAFEAAPSPGFADPVHDAQRAFRATLDAMARPGTARRLPVLPPAPAPLSPEQAAILLTLADFETPVWLSTELDSPAVRAWLRFHCGCPLVETPEEAAFAVFTTLGTSGGNGRALAGLDRLSVGTAEWPDRSATALIHVAGLAEGGGWRLTGPGVKDEAWLEVAGAAPELLELLARNRAGFPLGVDVILTAQARVAGLPRSLRVEA